MVQSTDKRDLDCIQIRWMRLHDYSHLHMTVNTPTLTAHSSMPTVITVGNTDSSTVAV